MACRESQLDAMTDEFRHAGIRAAGFAADVTDRPALGQALAQAEEHFGSIDVLEYSPAPTVADLQAHPLVSAPHLTVEAALPLLETNLFGAITAIGQVLPGMLERGSGTILGTSGAGSGPTETGLRTPAQGRVRTKSVGSGSTVDVVLLPHVEGTLPHALHHPPRRPPRERGRLSPGRPHRGLQ
ncbi:SDR family NAD(P)-dependent oxidoreductase [Brachybacterium sp.]|uniref:SDR family NAD(P)-dependent oxidoreductase n=1 Tax=Brachybacterium sp. TaxID=1891286 RepID=UPI002ED06FB8